MEKKKLKATLIIVEMEPTEGRKNHTNNHCNICDTWGEKFNWQVLWRANYCATKF
jgi:hypothetical protein